MKKVLFAFLLLTGLVLVQAPYAAYCQEDSTKMNNEEDANNPDEAPVEAKHKVGNPSFTQGQVDINPGIGLISVVDQALQDDGYSTSTQVPPVSITVDYGIADFLSVGLYVGYTKTQVSSDGSDIATVSHSIIGLRLLYHFKTYSNFDPYVGAMGGFNSANISYVSDYSGDNLNVSSYTYSLLAGCRYRFSQNVGVFLELGYGVAVTNLGLNFKFAGHKVKPQAKMEKDAWE